MAQLLVVVPGSRKLCGRLVLLSGRGETMCGPFRVLAKASRRIGRKHGNPTCARELPFGDPPAGRYQLIGSLPPSTLHRRPRRFGRLGALLLEPCAGEALSAFEKGRRLFALHGGITDRIGRLYPTRGGLRLEDANLLTLFRAVNAAQAAGDPVLSLDLIDISASAILTFRDSRPARRRRRQPRQASSGGLGLSAIFAAMAGQFDGRPMERRRFLATALLLVGGISAEACDTVSPSDRSRDLSSYPPEPGGSDGGAADGGRYMPGSDGGTVDDGFMPGSDGGAADGGLMPGSDGGAADDGGYTSGGGSG